MPDIYMDVDVALTEVPVNIISLIDDTDFKTEEDSVVYNATDMALVWNFTKTNGVYSQTACTPTSGGAYDWKNQGNGMYTIEIPASGGVTVNNDEEGFGYWKGKASGILSWRGPIIGFRAAGLNNLLIDNAFVATRGLSGTALPDAVADAAGGIPISDAGGLDLDIAQKKGMFESGFVWVDDDGTNSTTWPYGSAPYPTTTIANGKTIADANEIRNLHIYGNHTLGATMEFYNFVGEGYYHTDAIDLNSQDVDHSTFTKLVIIGVQGGGGASGDLVRFSDCLLVAATGLNGVMVGGAIKGACGLADGGYFTTVDTYFGGSVACTLTLQAPGICSLTNMRGAITLSGMDGGACVISMQNGATVTIDNTCTAGTITITGDGTITDNSGAGCTVNITRSPVNTVEVGGTNQTANDNGADINTLVTNVGSPADIDSGGATLADNLKKIADDNDGADFDATTDSLQAIRDYVAPSGEYDTEMARITANVATAASLADLDATIGEPVNIDLGGATIAGNLKRLADDNNGADFDAATDSLQAIRDRGDAAWTTGGGSGSATAASLAALDAKIGEPANIDLGGANLSANLKKIADDNAGADFNATTDSLQAIRDRGDSAWTTGAGGSDRLLMVDTTIATLASQTSFTLTGGSTDNNAYLNCTIVIEDATTAAQKAVGLISGYTGATKTVTLKYDPGIFTMQATDKVYILAENALKSTAQNRQLDVTSNGNAGIDWGNIENKTTVVDLTQTDFQLCDTVTTNSDMRGTDGANTTVPDAAGVAATPAEVATALTDIGLDHLISASVSDEVVNNSIIAKLVSKDATADWSDYNWQTESLEALYDGILATIGIDVAGLNGDAMRGTDNAATASALTTHDNKLAPVALDGGNATIGGMLTKMADDNGGSDFDAGTDSLQEIRDRGDAAWTTGGGGSGSNVTHIASATLTNMGGRNFELFFNNSGALTTKKVNDVGVAGSGFDPDTHDLGDGLMMTDGIRKACAVLFGDNTLSTSDAFTCKDYGGVDTELVLTKTGDAVNRTTG